MTVPTTHRITRPSVEGTLGDHERRLRRGELGGERWIYVGTTADVPDPLLITADSPPFQNGWTNAGGSDQLVSFESQDNLWVAIRGVPTGGADGSVVFTLPVGYRPLKTEFFPGAVSDGSGVGSWKVEPTGDVTWLGVTAVPSGGGVTEYDYVEITSNVTTTSNVDAIVGDAVTYDGTTRIMVEVFVPAMFIQGNATDAHLRLYEGASELGILSSTFLNSGTTVTEMGAPAHVVRFLTPDAGSHTYRIVLFRVGAGTAGLACGTGGSGNFMPAYMRITKA